MAASSILNDIGWVLIDENIDIDDIDERIRLLNKALSLKPNEPFMLDTLGWGY